MEVITLALAARDLKVSMISGRELGFPGGMLNKLESITCIPLNTSHNSSTDSVSFRIQCELNERANASVFYGFRMLHRWSNGHLVPVDRLMYAARDVTTTINITINIYLAKCVMFA